MKIIHLILGKARPERMNGVSKVAHQLAHTQALMGHEVEMWGLTPTPDEQLPARSYQLRLFMQKGSFTLDKSLDQAIRNLKGSDVCFHIHGGFIFPFFRISRALYRHGIPYVFTPHGSYSPFAFHRSGLKKKTYFFLFEAGMVKKAKALQFLGKSGYMSFDRLLKINHKVLIPNGQDMSELEISPVGKVNSTFPVFSFCGRLINHYKGLDMLMDAFGQYKKEGGRGKLWLIGDGPDRKKLQEQMARNSISKDVIFWGSQYGEEKLRLLSESDAFVHPSRSEGFPTSVLEAAGLGLPCVLSEATNAADYIRHHKAGIALDINDVPHITAALFAIEKAKAQGTLEEMARNARAMVIHEFDWRNIAGRLVELYGGQALVPA